MTGSGKKSIRSGQRQVQGYWKGQQQDGKRAAIDSGTNRTGKARQEHPDKFPYKCYICGEKGHKAVQCGKGKRSKKGAYGVDEGEAADTGADTVQDLGDLDLCAIQEVWDVGAGPVRPTRRTSRQESSALARSTPGPGTSTSCRGATHGRSSPAGTSERHCTLPRPARPAPPALYSVTAPITTAHPRWHNPGMCELRTQVQRFPDAVLAAAGPGSSARQAPDCFLKVQKINLNNAATGGRGSGSRRHEDELDADKRNVTWRGRLISTGQNGAVVADRRAEHDAVRLQYRANLCSVGGPWCVP